MKLKEKLELALAYSLLDARMDLAHQVSDLLEAIYSYNPQEVVLFGRRLGLSQKDIRELLWEVRFSNT